ncbi:MAG: hypothetical protein Q8942_08430 [Bacillota bacterium]|nr:hypothetical protein [Bacillota bacterium]
MYEYYHSLMRDPAPPFGQQFTPPFGPPSTQQAPPFGLPSTQGPSSGPPSGPPPSFLPQQAQAQTHAPGVFAIDPGAIRPCIFRYVYLWLNTGEQFWAWLVFVGRRSASGWRWTGFRWIYFGIDLRNIESFVCY